MSNPAPTLGAKYTCFKCECKFYDLGRAEPLCPQCGADQREDPNPDPREEFLARFRRQSGGRKSRAKRKPPKAVEVTSEFSEDGSLLDDNFESDGDDDEPPEDVADDD